MFFPILASILPLLSAFSAFLRPMTGKRQPDAKSAQAIKRHKKRTTRSLAPAFQRIMLTHVGVYKSENAQEGYDCNAYQHCGCFKV